MTKPLRAALMLIASMLICGCERSYMDGLLPFEEDHAVICQDFEKRWYAVRDLNGSYRCPMFPEETWPRPVQGGE